MAVEETKIWTPTPDGMLDTFVKWFNLHVADYDVAPIKKEEAYIVWFCYIVGNAKALVSTTRPDHKYYEITFHEDKGMIYVDEYLKVTHTEIRLTEASKLS